MFSHHELCKSNTSTHFIRCFSGILVLLILFAFVTLVTQVRPPVGDDILSQMSEATNYYLDGNDKGVGQPITNTELWLHSIENTYHTWSGRIFGTMLLPLLSFCGQKVIGLISGAVFVAIVFLAACLVVGNCRKVFGLPLLLFVFSYLLVYSSCSVYYTFMWTMVCYYMIALLFYLLYSVLAISLFFNDNKIPSVAAIIGFNVLGLLTGITHEMTAAIFLVYLFAYLIFNRDKLNCSFFKLILQNAGLLVGVAVCVLSPGNLMRANQSHDGLLLGTGYFSRLNGSVLAHWDAFKPTSIEGVIIFSVVTLLSVYCFLTAGAEKEDLLRKGAPCFAACIASVLLWATVSYVPSYGVVCTVVLYLVMIFYPLVHGMQRLKSSLRNNLQRVESVLCIVLAVVFIFIQMQWIPQFVETRKEWDQLISQAQPGEDVVVPRFPESTNNIYTMDNFNNNRGPFQTDYYQQYYGGIIVPE